ncbi:MAG: hypothetical protein ACRD2L_20195, partial [Terriglobia bacterium]
EKILEAKTESLDSDRIQEAMAGRAEWEAGILAEKILGDAAAPQALRSPKPVEVWRGNQRVDIGMPGSERRREVIRSRPPDQQGNGEDRPY